MIKTEDKFLKGVGNNILAGLSIKFISQLVNWKPSELWIKKLKYRFIFYQQTKKLNIVVAKYRVFSSCIN